MGVATSSSDEETDIGIEDVTDLSPGDEVQINDRANPLTVEKVHPGIETLNVHGGNCQYVDGAAALSRDGYEYTLYQGVLGDLHLAVASGAVIAGMELPKKRGDAVEQLSVERAGQQSLDEIGGDP